MGRLRRRFRTVLRRRIGSVVFEQFTTNVNNQTFTAAQAFYSLSIT